MSEPEKPPLRSLPSLMEFGRQMRAEKNPDGNEQLFYTCPQCGHAMVSKKCKIVCRRCHYFIGCVE
jgi:rubrerythrin